jgi:hypothetical protein
MAWNAVVLCDQDARPETDSLPFPERDGISRPSDERMEYAFLAIGAFLLRNMEASTA